MKCRVWKNSCILSESLNNTKRKQVVAFKVPVVRTSQLPPLKIHFLNNLSQFLVSLTGIPLV